MEEWIPYAWGWCSALLVGLSKTGLPGVSMLAILLMTEAFAYDAKLAMGAMLPVLLVGDVFAVFWYRHHAQWDRLWKLLPCVALGMIPGWFLLESLEEGNDLRPILGVLILALLAVEVGRRRFDLEHLPRQWWFVLLMGSLAGFSTILAHAAFPVMAIYLISQEMNKHEFIGTAAWFFFILNACKVPIYLQMGGMITGETAHFDLFVAPVAIVGGLLGVAVLSRIPQKLFDALALILAGVAAVRLILA